MTQSNQFGLQSVQSRLAGTRALRLGLRTASALVLTAMLCCTPALMTAQTQNTGTVSGNVNDAQGGIVLGATAVLTSTDRNVKVTVTVNERGEYLFPQVTPGVYTLTVTASTF